MCIEYNVMYVNVFACRPIGGHCPDYVVLNPQLIGISHQKMHRKNTEVHILAMKVDKCTYDVNKLNQK